MSAQIEPHPKFLDEYEFGITQTNIELIKILAPAFQKLWTVDEIVAGLS